MLTVSRQAKLFRAEGDPGSASRPYVPVLLIKQGERQALQRVEAATRDLFTPWLRVLPPEAAGEHAERTRFREMGRIAQASPERAVYLDAVGTPRRRGSNARIGDAFVRRVYEDALAADLPFLPVFPFGRPDLMTTIAAFQSPSHGAAVLVRSDATVMTDGRNLEDKLRDQVKDLAIEPARLDVMIDFGYLPPGLADPASATWLVRKVVGAAPWRSVIIAATSVPDSFAAEVLDDSVGGVERRERGLFQAIDGRVDFRLRYADYAVQHPIPPKPGFAKRARAAFRYTSGNYIHVSRGKHALGETPRDDWPSEFQRVATRLINEAPFAGVDCCWGDRFVVQLATGSRRARSHQGMRAAATCHHLSAIARELSPSQPHATRPTYGRRAPVTVTERM